MTLYNRFITYGYYLILGWGICVAGYAQEGSSEPPPDTDEWGFAAELLDVYGLPEYAEIVVDQLRTKFPGQKDRVNYLIARIRVRQGKVEDAEKIVASFKEGNPKAQGVKLELAIFYHRQGEKAKSQKLFDEFFAVYKDELPTDPDVRLTYQTAAYTLAEISKSEGKFAEAVKYYRMIIKGSTNKDKKRTFMVEAANTLVELAKKQQGDAQKKTLAEAEKFARDAMWNYDIIFGRAVVSLAYVRIIGGDREGALELIKNYKNDILTIENEIRDGNPGMLWMSPRCHLRYLTGEVIWEDTKKLHAAKEPESKVMAGIGRAATEFINAFLKYQGNEYSDKSGLMFNVMDEWAKANGFGALQAPPGVKGAIMKRYLDLADRLRQQRQFAEAIPKYLDVLNQYPETPASGEGLGNLALCFTETKDDLSALATVRYMADRFTDDQGAAKGVLRVLSKYGSNVESEQYRTILELFGLNFPSHPNAAKAAFNIAELKRKDGLEADAMQVYETIIAKYPKDKVAVLAAERLGFFYFDSGDYPNAEKYFNTYVDLAQPGPTKADGWFKLANTLSKIGKLRHAIKEFSRLKKELDKAGPNKDVYYGDPEDAVRSEALLEQTMFFFGQSLAQLPEGAPNRDKFFAVAKAEFEGLLKEYPKSPFAPKALKQLGMINLKLDNVDDAVAAFERIAKEYPETPGADDITYLIIDTAGKAGLKDLVKTYSQKVIDDPSPFSAQKLIRIGLRLVDFELYDEAEIIMGLVSKHPDAQADEKILQRALHGQALAAYKRGRYQEALDAADSLLEKYPTSPFKLDVTFIKVSSLRELKRYDEAITMLGAVTKDIGDLIRIYPDRKEEFQLAETVKEAELSSTFAAAGDVKKAIATVFRLSLNVNTPAKKAIFKPACLQAIQWCLEEGKYDAGVEFCATFINLYALDKENNAKVRELRNQLQQKINAGTP
ncbi:MAG: TolA-binding protein [Candidatus Omnitrophota bacterium]|jgi:TolA-binding protein